MKISFLTLLFAWTIYPVLGQKVIWNTVDKEYLKISNSRVSLIPPAEFKKGWFGVHFNHQSGAHIGISNMLIPVAVVKSGMRSTLAQQGISIDSKEDYLVNGVEATLVTGHFMAGRIKMTSVVLYLGNQQETYKISGAFADSRPELDAVIKKSLLSVVYEENGQIAPMEPFGFTMDLQTSGFELLQGRVGAGLEYTPGGVPSNVSGDLTRFSVSMASSRVPVSNKEAYALNRVKNQFREIEKTESSREIVIDSIPGYEIVVSGKSKSRGNAQRIYQAVLFDEAQYYLISGTCAQDFDKNITQFQKMASSFQRK